MSVEHFNPWADGLVEFTDTEEGQIAQGSEDLILSHLHRALDFRLVLGFSRTRREDRRAVVFRHFLVSAVQNGLVTTCQRDTRFGIVGHRQQRDPAIKGVGMHVGCNPGTELLIGKRFGEYSV